jgi:hypothetical protein
MEKKVKNILFKWELEGNGIMNYDSNEQKRMFEYGDLLYTAPKYNNVNYAKKNFYNDNGKLKYKLKMSSNCVRYMLFNETKRSAVELKDRNIKLKTISSQVSLICGYLFTYKGDTINRSSALCFIDPEQTNNSVSNIETYSSSAPKTTSDDKSDNTFFKKENIGIIEYYTHGNINIERLQFTPVEETLGRKALNSDDFNDFKTLLNKNIGNFNSELSNFIKNDAFNGINEYGFILSDENISKLVKFCLSKIYGLYDYKTTAFVKTKSLKIKLVYDPIVDTINNESDWIEINSVTDLNFINEISYKQFYTKNDE